MDNIPAELVQAGGEAMLDILTSICNKIWKTGLWPSTWIQSLVITLPKKGNLRFVIVALSGLFYYFFSQLCQNYRTISIIRHHSKVNVEDHTKQIPATNRCDHCRRASRFQSWKEHHRTNIQSQSPLREIPAASAESLSCLHRLQEGL